MNTSLLDRTPTVLPPKEQRWMDCWGTRVMVLVTGAQTDGRYTMLEYVAPPGGLGPPIHYHREIEESFRILEGELNFQVADRRVVAGPGTFLHVPAGVPHAFWNSSDKPARFIGTISPAGFEQYFAELFALARKRPEMTQDVRPLIGRIAARYDQVVVGPSPAVEAEKV